MGARAVAHLQVELVVAASLYGWVLCGRQQHTSYFCCAICKVPIRRQGG